MKNELIKIIEKLNSIDFKSESHKDILLESAAELISLANRLNQ